MTVKDFVCKFETRDMRSGARHYDGSGNEDKVTIIIHVTGHGALAEAEIRDIVLSDKQIFIHSKGDTSVDEYQKRWLEADQKRWDELFARANQDKKTEY